MAILIFKYYLWWVAGHGGILSNRQLMLSLDNDSVVGPDAPICHLYGLSNGWVKGEEQRRFGNGLLCFYMSMVCYKQYENRLATSLSLVIGFIKGRCWIRSLTVARNRSRLDYCRVCCDEKELETVEYLLLSKLRLRSLHRGYFKGLNSVQRADIKDLDRFISGLRLFCLFVFYFWSGTCVEICIRFSFCIYFIFISPLLLCDQSFQYFYVYLYPFFLLLITFNTNTLQGACPNHEKLRPYQLPMQQP